MRKNWLAADWAPWFRAQPLVPDAAFQDATEPYPGHWRRFPEPWPAAPVGRAGPQARTAEQQMALDAALTGLPPLWRRVVTAHDVRGRADQQVADELGLTLEQERDILARARAAVRDQLDRTQTDGPR
jgi:RNA polymerase sigma-70 factor (ECF subfamily)